MFTTYIVVLIEILTKRNGVILKYFNICQYEFCHNLPYISFFELIRIRLSKKFKNLKVIDHL
jgi:hypothetical protein